VIRTLTYNSFLRRPIGILSPPIPRPPVVSVPLYANVHILRKLGVCPYFLFPYFLFHYDVHISRKLVSVPISRMNVGATCNAWRSALASLAVENP
jgi:hypothetical protein